MSAKNKPDKEDTTSSSSPETPVTKGAKLSRNKPKPDASVPAAEQPLPVKKAAISAAGSQAIRGDKQQPATGLPHQDNGEEPNQEMPGGRPVKRNLAVAEPSSGAQRVKIAELATQLVAAQIAAHASYQAAVDVASEQRELLAESLETLARLMKPGPAPTEGSATDSLGEPVTDPDQEPIKDEDPEAAVEQSVLQIIRERFKYAGVRIRKPRVLSPLSGSELDQLFASAMYRAQKMLRAPEQDYRTVWAEQIFEDDETLSENQISERFIRYGWPDLSSRPSVIGLMADVDRWFSEHYRKLAEVGGNEDQGSELENAQDETAILVRAMELCDERERDGSNRYRRDYKAVADAIKCFLRSGDARVLGTLAAASTNDRARSLIFMLYNESAPAPRDSDPGDDTQTTRPKAPTRLYRPWGIFRYLRLYAGKPGDANGTGINSRIRTQVIRLNPALMVNVRPVAPPEFEFGPIGAEMDDLMDSL